jgi:hypothetical protein
MSYPQGPQYGGYPPQQPGYQQQQGYPQQHGGYSPPGYPQPPRKNNTGLIVALAGVAAAAVIALVLVLVLSNKDDSGNSADPGKPGLGNGGVPGATVPGPGKVGVGAKPTGGSGGSGASGSARALAEKAIEIINAHSTSQIASLTCDSNATKELTNALSTLPSSATAELTDVKESGDYGQAFITISANGQTRKVTMEMAQHSGKWCAAGL